MGAAVPHVNQRHQPQRQSQLSKSRRPSRPGLLRLIFVVLITAMAATTLVSPAMTGNADAQSATGDRNNGTEPVTARVFFVGNQTSGYAILGASGAQTRQWISEACRTQLADAGMPLESVHYNEVLAVPETSDWLTCDEIEDRIDVSDPADPDPTDPDDTGGYRPHLRGPGSDTPGGRGGDILRVTNLNDTGPGSFRDAVTASGPRIVLFEVSGTVQLDSPLFIDDGRLTIAGQSAPSPGITIHATCGIRLEAEDVVIQHLRIRRGDHNRCPSSRGIANHLDTVWIRNNAARIIFDHVSVSWGIDGSLDINAATGPQPTDIVIADSIISETLKCSYHVEISPNVPCHSRAMLVAPNASGGSNLTLARNLFAHHSNRFPAVSAGWNVTNHNNVMYNHSSDPEKIGRHGAADYINGRRASFAVRAENHIAQIGTVAISGPDTPPRTKTIRTQNLFTGSTMYLRDNVGYLVTGPTGDGQWSSVHDSGVASTQADFRTDTEPAYLRNWDILPSNETEGYVLSAAGARPLDRDPVDARIVNDVRTRGGFLIDSQEEVGGLPRLAVNTRRLNVPDNPHGVVDLVGRTAIEAWLEAMARSVEPGSDDGDDDADDIVLFDFDTSSERFWVYTKPDSDASANRSINGGVLGVSVDLAAQTHAWFGRDVPVSNWSDHRGLSFDYVGLNNGKRVTVVFHEGERRERFAYTFVDDQPFGRTITVPFSEFKRSTHQPPGAPDNGQNLVGVRNLYFQLRGEAAGTVKLDNITLTNQL